MGKPATHALINNILDFSKIEAGRKEYRLSLPMLREIVETVLRTTNTSSGAGFEVSTRIDQGLPDGRIDGKSHLSAVVNLLNNATKYSETPRRLK